MEKMEYEIAKESGISLFENGKYKEAFYIFMGLYNETKDLSEKKWIESVIMEAYYFPNKEEQDRLYCENVKLIEKYPFVHGESVEEEYVFCPISEEQVCIFDQKEDKWIEEVSIHSKRCTRNLFEKYCDEVLYYENEMNFYHLTYLNSIVRKSEYYGGDNHIYLWYDTMHFQLLLRCINLEMLLKDEKFVFLIGEEYKEQYPVDFKQYGIDYSKIKTKEFHATEINRIVFNKWYGYSGTNFFHSVLNGSDHVLDVTNWEFYSSSRRIQNLYHYYVEHPRKKIKISAFILFLEKYKEEIHWQHKEEIVTRLVQILVEQEEKEIQFHMLWKWIAIAMMRYSYEVEGKQYYSRIIPTIFWDAHTVESQRKHYALLECFEYPALAGVIRDPVIKLIRSIESLGVGDDKDILRKVVVEICNNSADIPDSLMEQGYFVLRFEDLKKDPEPVLRKFCEKIQIPYSQALLKGEVGIYGIYFKNERGEVLQGFEKTSIVRDLTSSMTEYDRVRLEMAYRRIKAYFGYATIPEVFYTKEEWENIFATTFLFEKNYANRRAEILKVLPSVENKAVKEDYERRFYLEFDDVKEVIERALIELCVNDKLYEYRMPELIK